MQITGSLRQKNVHVAKKIIMNVFTLEANLTKAWCKFLNLKKIIVLEWNRNKFEAKLNENIN